jgi:outer membrane immunogenic protein
MKSEVAMKNRFVGSAAVAVPVLFAAIAATPSYSADYPVEIAAPVPVLDEESLWDRFYVGVYGGYGLGDVEITTDSPPSNLEQSFNIDGAVLGLTVGKNFLLGENDARTPEDDRRLVLGVEADIAWAGMNGNVVGFPDPSYQEAGIDAIGTLRGRLGLLVGDERRTLAYLTGGAAAAHAYAELEPSGPPRLTASDWMYGYTVGGGIEHFVNDDVTVKLEYLYTDLATQLPIETGGAGGINIATHDIRANHLVRLGLNYHF